MPRVLINMAMTADGKITTADRPKTAFTSRADRRRMEEVRALADAIVIGTRTLNVDDPPFHITDKKLIEGRLQRGQKPQPLPVAVSGSLDIDPDLRFFRREGPRPLILTGSAADQERQRQLADLVEIVAVGKGARPEPVEVLGELARRGVGTVLLEAGGTFNAAWWEMRLVNELYLTVAPLVLGGKNALTPVEGRGFSFAGAARLELLSAEPVGGEVFLHYRVIQPGTLGAKNPETEEAWVLLDHGSPKPEAHQSLLALCRLAENLGPVAKVVPAHMECAAPTLAEALAGLAAKGFRRITVLPYFLAPGKHMEEDIPRLVQEAARTQPGLHVLLAEPLGVHEGLVSVLTQRAEEAEDVDVLGGSEK